MENKLVSYKKNLPNSKEMVSNRLPHSIDDYLTVPVADVERYEKGIQDATELSQIVRILDEMSDSMIAIVGSRGYLYRADAIVDLVEDIREKGYHQHVITQITRSLGLRAKVYDIMAAVKK